MLLEMLRLEETENIGVINNEQVSASLLLVDWEIVFTDKGFFFFTVIISEPAGGEQLVKMTVMGKREEGAIIKQFRCLESLVEVPRVLKWFLSPQGETGSCLPEQPLCCDFPLQEAISPQEMLPSGLDQSFRGPLGLSKSCQITNGP